ncbi:MAG TPA: hypothetical protein VN948_09710 [Terriglobales bacterium]|nr:hypothetical protein [Terriglobales bacterium]
MAHHYIPFANSVTDWRLVNSLYPQAAGCRITLQSVKKAGTEKLPSPKLWVDAEVDGLRSPEVFTSDDESYRAYKQYILQFENSRMIADPQFQADPDRTDAAVFVNAVLKAAVDAVPNLAWLSVPQLPYTADLGTKRINKMLAELTSQWKSAKRRPVQLILPVIFDKQRGQTDKKADRDKRVRQAVACFRASGADGVWIVDSMLDDQAGVSTFENERFPGIIKFHEELTAELPKEAKTVAGPYWGLNLVLWARGAVRCPAVGVGRSYRYYVAGRQPKSAKSRVALAPLKRLAVWSPALKTWLRETLADLSRNDPVYGDFATLLKKFDVFQTKERARQQVAEFYRDWLDKLESVPASSTALTLYQDFSSAFVLGKKLKRPIPSEDVKDPARIAKQLMVNCL